jgi:hypothetical protein
MEKKVYECEKCNFETKIKQAYEKHLESGKHKTGKNKIRSDKICPDKCELCNFKPYDNRSYIEHKFRFHATEEEKIEKLKYYCKYCDYLAHAESQFKTHTLTKKHKMMSDE